MIQPSNEQRPSEADGIFANFFAWVRAIFVWVLAVLIVIAVLFVGGRYAIYRFVPGDLPSGDLMRTLGSTALSAKESGHVRYWTWLQVRLVGFTVLGDWNPVRAIAFREDDRRLLSVSPSEMILWDLDSGNVAARVLTSEYLLEVRELSFYSSGSRIALFSDYEGIQIFDGKSLEPLGTIPEANGGVITARRDAAGNLWYVAAGDESLVIQRIEGEANRVLFRYAIPPYDFDGALNAGPRPQGVRLDPDRRRLVLDYGDGSRKYLRWDANFAVSEIDASGVDDFPEGIVVEAEDFESNTAIVRSRSVPPRADLARLDHIGNFTAAAVSSNGRLIATGSEDMLVRIWQAPVVWK